jgi:septal ring factor EnvC (AmiA/AmiB activator)
MKRRFVQDGEVPVTVVRRGSDAGSPSASPLQRAETALAHEVSACKNVERLLADTQAQIRDLQTKIGHAELARAEADNQARRDKETLAELRAAADESVRAHREILERSAAAGDRVKALQASLREEQSARATAEAKLVAAEDARRSMEARINELSTQPASPRSSGHSTPPPLRSVARKQTKGAAAKAREPEPEPIKWWLTPAKPTKRR